MFPIRTTICTLLLLTCFTAKAIAKMPPPPDNGGQGHDCVKCHKLTIKEAEELLSFANVSVKSIKPAPSNGLFEIMFEQGDKTGIVYIDFGKNICCRARSLI